MVLLWVGVFLGLSGGSVVGFLLGLTQARKPSIVVDQVDGGYAHLGDTDRVLVFQSICRLSLSLAEHRGNLAAVPDQLEAPNDWGWP